MCDRLAPYVFICFFFSFFVWRAGRSHRCSSSSVYCGHFFRIDRSKRVEERDGATEIDGTVDSSISRCRDGSIRGQTCTLSSLDHTYIYIYPPVCLLVVVVAKEWNVGS